MKAPVDPTVANMTGPAALPRKNGELVFEAPWQGRAFGMAVALRDRGHFDWDEFRDRLIAEIAEHGGAEAPADAAALYYEQWLGALEELLLQKGVLSKEELEARAEELATGKRDDVF